MSSCSKQKRAALVKWRGSEQSSHCKQGGSHGQYSQGWTTAAVQIFPTAAPTTTQAPATLPQTTAAVGRAGAFGRSFLPQWLRRGVHTSDVLPLLCFGTRLSVDCRQPHDPESAAHAWKVAAGTGLQL